VINIAAKIRTYSETAKYFWKKEKSQNLKISKSQISKLKFILNSKSLQNELI